MVCEVENEAGLLLPQSHANISHIEATCKAEYSEFATEILKPSANVMFQHFVIFKDRTVHKTWRERLDAATIGCFLGLSNRPDNSDPVRAQFTLKMICEEEDRTVAVHTVQDSHFLHTPTSLNTVGWGTRFFVALEDAMYMQSLTVTVERLRAYRCPRGEPAKSLHDWRRYPWTVSKAWSVLARLMGNYDVQRVENYSTEKVLAARVIQRFFRKYYAIDAQVAKENLQHLADDERQWLMGRFTAGGILGFSKQRVDLFAGLAVKIQCKANQNIPLDVVSLATHGTRQAKTARGDKYPVLCILLSGKCHRPEHSTDVGKLLQIGDFINRREIHNEEIFPKLTTGSVSTVTNCEVWCVSSERLQKSTTHAQAFPINLEGPGDANVATYNALVDTTDSAALYVDDLSEVFKRVQPFKSAAILKVFQGKDYHGKTDEDVLKDLKVEPSSGNTISITEADLDASLTLRSKNFEESSIRGYTHMAYTSPDFEMNGSLWAFKIVKKFSVTVAVHVESDVASHPKRRFGGNKTKHAKDDIVVTIEDHDH
eukprot:SAG11_NODE_5115_length_1659_cov_1.047436_1_plen_540_part_01